jgi:hypothetical protein
LQEKWRRQEVWFYWGFKHIQLFFRRRGFSFDFWRGRLFSGTKMIAKNGEKQAETGLFFHVYWKNLKKNSTNHGKMSASIYVACFFPSFVEIQRFAFFYPTLAHEKKRAHFCIIVLVH